MEENNFKISAIINTNNSEKTICDTLESIKDIDEIIIVDNHSKDDTIEFAREYRAKIIYALKNEMLAGFNQAFEEALGDWILILEDDEIIPHKLMLDIRKYIENPKKNKNCVSFYHKTFYLNKELKAARKKNVLRLFYKNCAQFDKNFNLIAQKSKIQKIAKCFDTQKTILKFPKKDIFEEFSTIIEKTKIEFKNKKTNSFSLISDTIFEFLYRFLIKKAFLDAEAGFIFAFKKAFEKFILKCAQYEKTGADNDF